MIFESVVSMIQNIFGGQVWGDIWLVLKIWMCTTIYTHACTFTFVGVDVLFIL